jgi:uncharacterized membrane protein
MTLGRIFRHWLTGPYAVKRAFPARTMSAIEQAIRETEATHTGQIRFAVEHALPTRALLQGLTTRERALEVFSLLRMWDTEHNNGVLIYLLLADRTVEIVADRGIHARLGDAPWQAICRDVEAQFGEGRFEAGVLAGIHAVGSHLRRHFPAQGPSANELSNTPVVL